MNGGVRFGPVIEDVALQNLTKRINVGAKSKTLMWLNRKERESCERFSFHKAARTNR